MLILPINIINKILLYNSHPIADIFLKSYITVFCFDGYDKFGRDFFGRNKDGDYLYDMYEDDDYCWECGREGIGCRCDMYNDM
jgi:hypothetical protein